MQNYRIEETKIIESEWMEMYYMLGLLLLCFLFGSIAAIIRAVLDRREIDKQVK